MNAQRWIQADLKTINPRYYAVFNSIVDRWEIKKRSGMQRRESDFLVIRLYEENEFGKDLLVRIVSMLTKMIGSKDYIREESASYNIWQDKLDYDNDSDYDNEKF